MANIPITKLEDRTIVGMDIEELRREAASEVHGAVNKTMKQLLSVNDTTHNPVMRTAILEYMNNLNRHIKRKFLAVGITLPEDYARNGVVADANNYDSGKTER